MKITKTSSLTGKEHTIDLPVTNDELYRHHKGELAQNVWPNLTPSQREFLISGATEEEWDEVFGSGEEE